jgi:NADPH2:quinone reductase
LWRSGDVLGWIASGRLDLRIHGIYGLGDAPQAHRDLEGRKTAGKLLLAS